MTPDTTTTDNSVQSSAHELRRTEIKRVELEATRLRALSRTSAWRVFATYALVVVVVGQALFTALFTYDQVRDKRVAASAPSDVIATRMVVDAPARVPADSGDLIETRVVKRTPVKTTPKPEPRIVPGNGNNPVTPPGAFTLGDCDPNAPLCDN